MDEDGNNRGVRVRLTEGDVIYKGEIDDDDNAVLGQFINIENLIGSDEIDTLIGDDGDNVIEGGGGDDTLTGGDGTDTVSYRHSPRGVTVTINGTASQGDASSDRLSGFENIIGSAHDDILTGDTGDNVIEGLAGADTLDGDDHARTEIPCLTRVPMPA